MHAAIPQCLIAAASEFHLTLSKEKYRFNTYIDQAVRTATRLQAVRVLKRGGAEAGDAAGATDSERPGKTPKSSSKPTTPRGKDKTTAPTPKKAAAAAAPPA